MNSSLELATRDAILSLREKLSQVLGTVLTYAVDQVLSEEETLNHLLRDVIPACSKLSLQKKANTERGTLEKAGFEYSIEGSTVEVSVDSVTALLAEMIDPELRKILERVTEHQEHHA